MFRTYKGGGSIGLGVWGRGREALRRGMYFFGVRM